MGMVAVQQPACVTWLSAFVTASALQHFGNEQPFLLHAMATCVTRAWPVTQCCGNPRPCIWGCQGDIGKVRTAVAGVAVLLL